MPGTGERMSNALLHALDLVIQLLAATLLALRVEIHVHVSVVPVAIVLYLEQP